MSALTPRSERKRQQIVDAAGMLFMQQGFLTTSMDEVAQQAGVSKQTVYAHFGSKNELFVHCIRNKCGASELLMQPLAGEEPREVLMRFLTRFANVVFSDEAVFVHRLCVSQAETHPELSALFYDEGPRRIRHILETYLEHLHDQGILALEDTSLAASNLLLMARGMRHLKMELGLESAESEAALQQRLGEIVAFFLRGHGYRG